MTMAPILRKKLAEKLTQRLKQAEPGYCLRVDFLDHSDAESLCCSLRERIAGTKVQTWMVSTSPESNGLEITPERAIEIRNRKQVCLGLIVPVGVLDAAASSLANSFAAFDLQKFWKEVTRELLSELSDTLQAAVSRILATPRGVLVAGEEQRAEYLASICEAQQLSSAGTEMWRLGLLPDAGSDLVDRLERNLQCVRELSRPARAQSSAVERLEACKLRDGSVKTELLNYLRDKRLRDSRSWLQGLAREPNRGSLTFEMWPFEEGSMSNLESIDLVPLLDGDGSVNTKSGFQQDGPGAQPTAAVGPKSKVKLKWSCQPKSPTNLKRWRAEVIPSREFYTEESSPGVELPEGRASAGSRQVSITMNIDLPEEESSIAAQVRVVALDENGNELADSQGKTIEGLSDEFWIAEQAEPPPPPGAGRRATVQNLPMARLQAALMLPGSELEEAPGAWSSREIHYFSVRINNRFTARLGISPVLRRLEERVLDQSRESGCFLAESEGNETLDPDEGIHAVPLAHLAASEAGERFLKARKQFFSDLLKQETRKWLETVGWSSELSQRARSYAASYERLLKSSPAGPALKEALRIDTLTLKIEMADKIERSILILPTHPLRILWYAAYADLLSMWEAQLLHLERRKRSRVIDLDLLSHVSPLNCPPFVPSAEAEPFLFVQNLSFFWGVALPVGTPNPSRRVANISRAVGLADDESASADLPPEKVAQEFHAYHSVHRYLETLRLNVVNPGSGAFLAESLRYFYEGQSVDNSEGEEDSSGTPPRLELFAHVIPPVPPSLPPLSQLQREMYEVRPLGRHHHLSPFFSISIRSEEQVAKIPGGDVNLSLVMDRLQPIVQVASKGIRGDSCSFHGLLLRMLPDFTCGKDGAKWQHRFLLPEMSANARHPAYKTRSTALVELQRNWLEAVAQLTGAAGMPSVSVGLSAQEHSNLDAIHEISDWVITLDRFLGVEFFDTPGSPHSSAITQKYLLDYAPEFLDGLGHRMLVTTTHREEVEEILARGMTELGFRKVEDSVGQVLHYLKTISGRLALRILGDEGKAREAVSLGVVAAWLKSRGELSDGILIPIDSHPELFGPQAKRRSASRCDLLRIQLRPSRLIATFIEVKSRSRAVKSDELLNRIVDQVEATEQVFRDLFFQNNPPRIDHVLQRARLANILDFYLRRALRYGLIEPEDTRMKMEDAIAKLETGLSQLRVIRWGFVVNLDGKPQRPVRQRDTEIRFLTARDIMDAGLSEVSEESVNSKTGTLSTSEPQSPVVSETLPKMAPLGSVSTAELGHDIKPASVQYEGKARMLQGPAMAAENRDPPSPKQSSLAEVVNVELGMDLDQEPVSWKGSVRGSPHLFILGIPGQGKSWTTTRILCEITEQCLPALVIDFHGQFSEPSSRFAQIANPEVLDAVHGLPFSPFEADIEQTAGANWWRNNCFAIAEIFEYVCNLGDIQRDVVFEAIKDCYLDLGFEDGSPSKLPTIADFATRLKEIEEERGVKNVIPRCRPLLEFGLFRSTEQPMELSQLLQHGLVVDVHNLGIETLQLAAGAFVLRKVYKDMFHWGESDRLRLAIVLDEAHRLARDVTLPKIMKEGRKFGIAVLVASQGLADYHPDVVGNAGTKVVFRTNFPMSKKVAGFLRPPRSLELAEAIEQLEVGEAFVQTPEMNVCARVRMHPLQ